MDDGNGFMGEKLAPFNPSGDEVIRAAIEMLQVSHRQNEKTKCLKPLDKTYPQVRRTCCKPVQVLS